MAGLFEKNEVNVIKAMVETPLRFFEVNKEFYLPDSEKF